MKGVGRIYQQTLVDAYNKITLSKPHTMKTPILAVGLPARVEEKLTSCPGLIDRYKTQRFARGRKSFAA
ncbi:hypothetical protein [Pseudomonas fluorescens]|uniref:hypothetical protein n=1 Tax=Pseudomonas fluorescens TaxID=294 RepID=UPI001BE7F179|nr:hypothetical protein [Pseudomonas fluorescens]MBT2294333.1 hypothetical protein [Pseudomonas fluorescens]MBT2316079.1 hypothetical protein [Pseudomonas fluorescens]MBT2342685.1 hypothetical protein [Pseudomonas fluorescens]MBT2350485.1 hypothetical protein [Pseudomonas fluorescens]MBT2355886.1 hypothetical protein [Pseudomonas fluorescens]